MMQQVDQSKKKEKDKKTKQKRRKEEVKMREEFGKKRDKAIFPTNPCLHPHKPTCNV